MKKIKKILKMQRRTMKKNAKKDYSKIKIIEGFLAAYKNAFLLNVLFWSLIFLSFYIYVKGIPFNRLWDSAMQSDLKSLNLLILFLSGLISMSIIMCFSTEKLEKYFKLIYVLIYFFITFLFGGVMVFSLIKSAIG